MEPFLAERRCILLLQMSAVKQGIAELRAGLKKAEAEINRAADLVGTDEDAALMAQFANMMAAFHSSAAAAVARTEVWLPSPVPLHGSCVYIEISERNWLLHLALSKTLVALGVHFSLKIPHAKMRHVCTGTERGLP